MRRIGGKAYVFGDFVTADDLGAMSDLRQAQEGYSVILAGRDFGRGASASTVVEDLRRAGVRAVVAESFGPEFRKACASFGDVLPVECAYRLWDGFETGDCVELDLVRHHLRDANGSAAYPLRPMRTKGPKYVAPEPPRRAPEAISREASSNPRPGAA